MSEEAKKEVAKKVKMVQIRAKSAIRVDGKLINPGEVAECDEETAKQFCQPLKGQYKFSGERTKEEANQAINMIVRAEMVQAKSA